MTNTYFYSVQSVFCMQLVYIGEVYVLACVHFNLWTNNEE